MMCWLINIFALAVHHLNCAPTFNVGLPNGELHLSVAPACGSPHRPTTGNFRLYRFEGAIQDDAVTSQPN